MKIVRVASYVSILTILALLAINLNTVVQAAYDASSLINWVTKEQIESAEKNGAIQKTEYSNLTVTKHNGLQDTYNPQQAGRNQ